MDIALSAEGRSQADKTAGALAGIDIAAIYASPLARARETAEIIAKPHRLSVELALAFKEMSFGVWEGLTVDEVSARLPDAYRRWRDEPHTARFPSGGDLLSAGARARDGVEHLRGAHDGETVAVVSHGLMIRLLVLDALGLGPERLRAFRAAPGGITEIDYQPAFTTVQRMNTVQHLEETGGA